MKLSVQGIFYGAHCKYNAISVAIRYFGQWTLLVQIMVGNLNSESPSKRAKVLKQPMYKLN